MEVAVAAISRRTGYPNFTRRMALWLGISPFLLALVSTVPAGVLPEDRADVMYHSYEGGGVTVDGPSYLIRKGDNERFSETGRQRGLTGTRVDLCAVAKGFGIRDTMLVTSMSEISALAKFLFATEGPVFALAKIALTEDPWRLPEKDGAAIARRFQVALGLAKA